VARQKQPGWDEPEETLQARRDGDATMQPAVLLLLGSLPQPVFFTGVISRIAVGGGVRGRQFGESATTRSGGFPEEPIRRHAAPSASPAGVPLAISIPASLLCRVVRGLGS
jgi:hypothetical protein